MWLLIQRWASLDFWPYDPQKGVQYVTSAAKSAKQLTYAHFQILMKTAIHSTAQINPVLIRLSQRTH